MVTTKIHKPARYSVNWVKELFATEKPVIGMCHLEALPGDPGYDPQKGMGWVVERAWQEVSALQRGGVDGVMFSNERSLPYKTKVDPITSISMARVIVEIKQEINIPFGVNVLWDAAASIDLAVATEAEFVREIFTGVYASDFGLWDTNCGEVIRHQHAIHGQHVKLLFNIFPEASTYLAVRNPESIAQSTVFNTKPDGLCVSGLTAGMETDTQLLVKIKSSVPDIPIFANTGVNLSNIEDQLRIVDGVIVGTAFKRDGFIWNEVDARRTEEFMQKVKSIRDGIQHE